MRVCNICNLEKELSCFHKPAKGTEYRCKSCKSDLAKKNRKEDYFKHYCSTKKSECKRKGYNYNLTPEYLESIWTKVCPVFGMELFRASEGMGSAKSAHLDRIDPTKGYVFDNVHWISGRANRIKYDATIEELRQIADWMESVTTRAKARTSEANAGGSGEPLETE